MGYSSFNILNSLLSSNKYRTAVSLNKKNKSFCSFLFKNGFLDGYTIDSKNNVILIFLSKHHSKTSIKYVKQISKPGDRKYINYRQLMQWKNKNTFFVISSSKGIISSKEAIANKIGGELLYLFKC